MHLYRREWQHFFFFFSRRIWVTETFFFFCSFRQKGSIVTRRVFCSNHFFFVNRGVVEFCHPVKSQIFLLFFCLFVCFFCFFLLTASVTVFSLFFFSFSLSRPNSDPGSPSRLLSSLPTTVRAFVIIARRLQLFLPSSTRIELQRAARMRFNADQSQTLPVSGTIPRYIHENVVIVFYFVSRRCLVLLSHRAKAKNPPQCQLTRG